MDSKLFTLHTIETLWNKIKNKFYVKSANGIPKSDLNATVQSSLNKADSALQEHQDISGKQDKSTAVTHSANTAVGSVTKPVYIAANGAATPISHSINADVPANAKFTDTTYGDATESTHGLMTAADKKKLDGMDLTKYLPLAGGVMTGDINMATNRKDIIVGSNPASNRSEGTAIAGGSFNASTDFTQEIRTRKTFIGSATDKTGTWYNVLSVRHRNGAGDGINFGMYIISALTAGDDLIWNKQTAANTWQGERTLLDSVNYTSYAAKSDHTHAELANNYLNLGAAGGTVKWIRLGTIVSGGDGKTMVIRVWSGDGFNALTSQNSSFEIHIKDSSQVTPSSTKACAATVYRINCPDTVTVKIIPIDALTYTVWIHPSPWTYWNGNYAVYGYYKTWTRQFLTQDAEPTGTGAPIAYYDQAFLTSTVAAAETLTDSGWVTCPLAVTGNTTYPSSSSSIKVRKYGKLVRLEAVVKYTTAFGTGHNVAKIPEGYRPSSVQKEHGIITVASERIEFDATLGVGGNLSFEPAGSSSAKFNPGNSYECRMTYFID